MKTRLGHNVSLDSLLHLKIVHHRLNSSVPSSYEDLHHKFLVDEALALIRQLLTTVTVEEF